MRPQNFTLLSKRWGDRSRDYLIPKWLPFAEKRARELDAKFDADTDWQSLCCSGLYNAVYTWTPGQSGIGHWIHMCMQSSCGGYLRTWKRRRNLIGRRIPTEAVDSFQEGGYHL